MLCYCDIIMQRVHEADLTGHILANDLGDEWNHLCLPARYEPDHPSIVSGSGGNLDPRTERGELLWPHAVSISKVKGIAPTSDAREFAPLISS